MTMNEPEDTAELPDQVFVDPYDQGFDEKAAAKYPEYERLLMETEVADEPDADDDDLGQVTNA